MVMRFNRLDLNLLVAFNALLEERSVSRAAERLNMSQPAMSAALAKLREFFSDDLLVRSGREMIPTAQAAILVKPVTEVLTAISHAMTTRPSFDPATVQREFRLMMSDYIARVAMPELLKILRREAPHVTIEVVASDASMHARIERREIDLAIAPERFLSPDHPYEPVIEDPYVVVVDPANSAIGGAISIEDYVAADHVVANMSGNRQASFEDWFLQNVDIVRKVVITVPMFSLIPSMIVGTDMIATMHASLAASMAHAYDLRTVQVPDDFPKLQEFAQWHRLSSQDLGLIWLRGKLHDVFDTVRVRGID